MLVKHLRDKSRKPFGTIVAISSSEIGVSFCNPKDKFDKKMGTQIALGRAKSPNRIPALPNRDIDGTPLAEFVHAEYNEMDDRANRYFLGVTV